MLAMLPPLAHYSHHKSFGVTVMDYSGGEGFEASKRSAMSICATLAVGAYEYVSFMRFAITKLYRSRKISRGESVTSSCRLSTETLMNSFVEEGKSMHTSRRYPRFGDSAPPRGAANE